MFIIFNRDLNAIVTCAFLLQDNTWELSELNTFNYREKRSKTKRPMQQIAKCNQIPNNKTPNVTKRPIQQKAQIKRKRPNSEIYKNPKKIEIKKI